jgi:hypothetical protein
MTLGQRIQEKHMAALKQAIDGFHTGDMVFTRYPPKGVQPIHVTVFLEARDALQRSYVHAGAKELEVALATTYEDDKDGGGYLHATPTDATHREAVAEIARIFAQEVGRTPYGSYPGMDDFARMNIAPKSPHANRFTGMIRTTRIDDIPFDISALHRLLKWTYRALTRAPLSENRGITCAAFVAACHQIAHMRSFLQEVGVAYDVEKVGSCVAALDGMVQTKQSLRQGLELLGQDPQTHKSIYRDQAYRENSNRRLTTAGWQKLWEHNRDIQTDALPGEIQLRLQQLGPDLQQIDRQWLIIQTRLLGIHESQTRLIEDVIGQGFLFDAKYVSSPVLANLVLGSRHWNTTRYDKYEP